MKTQIRKPAAGKTLYAAEYREGQALRQAQGDRKGSGWACPDFSDTEFRVIWFGLVDVRTQQG